MRGIRRQHGGAGGVTNIEIKTDFWKSNKAEKDPDGFFDVQFSVVFATNKDVLIPK